MGLLIKGRLPILKRTWSKTFNFAAPQHLVAGPTPESVYQSFPGVIGRWVEALFFASDVMRAGEAGAEVAVMTACVNSLTISANFSDPKCDQSPLTPSSVSFWKYFRWLSDKTR